MAITHAGTRWGATADATAEGAIMATALGAVPQVLRELGVDPGAVLAAAGIDPEKLQDPHSTIPFTAMGRLAAQCVALTGCPHFGRLVGHRCSVDEAAALFGIHRRTLHRRLKREGVTFDALVEDVRADLAQELLAARNTRLSEIAGTLGYADVSAFSRAFRRWFGTTPARWRSEGGSRRSDPTVDG